MNYDRLTKRDLIEELTAVKKQLSKTLGKANAAPRNDKRGKRPVQSKKSGNPSSPAGHASERRYRVKDEDGTIRQIYEVVKDLHDRQGTPLYTEGALYEVTNGKGLTGTADTTEQTEIICRFRPDGSLTYVNEAYCRYFGCEREDLQDRNILLTISEQDRQKVLSQLQNLNPGHPVGTTECRVMNSFGELLWNQWSYRAIFDGEGHILEYHSVGRDITYRKYTQDVLEKRAAILEAMTAAAEGFLKNSAWSDKIEPVLESFGKATGANHVFLFENDVNRDEAVSVRRRFEWFSPAISSVKTSKRFLKTRDLATRFSRWVFAKSEGKPIYGTVGQFPDKEVESLALEPTLSIAVVPITVGGRWWGFVGFADYLNEIVWADDEIAPLQAAAGILGAAIDRDEREQKIRGQERFLSNIFDSIQDGIGVLDRDLNIVRANPVMENWPVASRPLVGRKCYEAIYGREKPCRDCPAQKTLKTGKSVRQIRPSKGPDGTLWMEIFTYPLRDRQNGPMTGVIEYVRDITERVNAEEARKLTEDRLQTFLNSTQDIVFLKDEQFRFNFVNGAMCDLLGRKEDEIIGRHDADLYPEGMAEGLRNADLRAMKSGAGVPTVSGSTWGDRVLEGVKFPVKLGDGRTGVGGIFRDVTERKRAEEELANTKILLEQAFEQSPNPMALVSMPDMIIRIANPAIREFLEITDEPSPVGQSLVGMKMSWKDCDLQGNPYPLQELPLPRALMGHETLNQEVMVVTKNGTVRLELASGVPIYNARGEILAGFLVCSDITERKRAADRLKQSEERLRTFIDSTKDMVFLKDDQRRFIVANKAGQELLGLREEDILGKTDFDFVPGESARRWRKTDLEALATERGVIETEDNYNGRTMRATKFRIDLGNGRAGLATAIRDVTEQRAAEEAIRESERRLSDIINFLPDPTFVIDAGGKVMVWNRAMEETTGVAAKDLVGKDNYEHSLCFYGERKPSLVDLVLKPDKKREKDYPSLKRKDGRLFAESYKAYSRIRKGEMYASAVASALRNAEGRVVGAIETFRDITDMKKAEASIREREAMLSSILRAAPIGISFGQERVLKWTNACYQSMTGYGEEQLAGQSTRLLYGSEEEFLRVGKALYGGVRKKDIGAAQTQWRCKEGPMIDVQLTMCPLFPKDLSRGVVVTALDITEKKRTEDALRASEARYRELADALPVGIYELSHDGIVTYANRTAMEMFGYEQDEVRRGVPFLKVIAPEEHETAIGINRRLLGGATMVVQEYNLVRTDGTRFTGLVMARPMMRNGRVVGTTGVVSDINDLKKAQEALRKNEALLQGILKAAPIGVGIVHDRVIGWVNEHFTRMTGYEGDDVIGKNARVLYPDDGEYERVGHEKYAEIRKGKTGALETRWRRKDGVVFDVYLSSNAIDAQDPASGVVFTAYDITDQKKAADILRFAKEELEKQVTERTRELDITNMLLRVELEEHRKTEEALAEKEQLYRAIVEDQTELICRFNPDGALSFVNEAFCRYFGKSRKELLGTRYRPPIPLEDRIVMTKAVKALTPDNHVTHFEIRVELPGHDVRWNLWTTRAIYDEVGRLVEHQAVGRDVTERVRSQQQIQESRNTLRSVFDGISDPLLMVGADLTIIMLNRAALEFFDVDHYRELIGLPCLGHLIERYGRDHAERFNAAIGESTPSRFNLTANVKAVRYEEISVYPVRGVDDGKGLAIIRVTDRTKQIIMERELIQNEKLASLGLLISGIVHEINNPNNFIVFNIPILRDYLREILPVVDEHAEKIPWYEVLGMPYADFRVDVMKLLDNIEHGSHRINVTVAKLKEFSRKREDKGLRAVASAEVVNKALSICHTQIRKTVKTFDVDLDPGLAQMTTDPEAIEQVLINLLINSAQAANKEDSLIRLHVYKGDSWKNRLVMEVIDNGCGMDAETVSRIFDPFFTTKEEGCGTGLGLYISKNLVESAGGSISVESEPDRGTTFRVIFPDMESRDPEKKNENETGVEP